MKPRVCVKLLSGAAKADVALLEQVGDDLAAHVVARHACSRTADDIGYQTQVVLADLVDHLDVGL